eukprot:COSAG04_NODE_268_length_18517_cov_9.260940_9_plen_291_part_00
MDVLVCDSDTFQVSARHMTMPCHDIERKRRDLTRGVLDLGGDVQRLLLHLLHVLVHRPHPHLLVGVGHLVQRRRGRLRFSGGIRHMHMSYERHNNPGAHRRLAAKGTQTARVAGVESGPRAGGRWAHRVPAPVKRFLTLLRQRIRIKSERAVGNEVPGRSNGAEGLAGPGVCEKGAREAADGRRGWWAPAAWAIRAELGAGSGPTERSRMRTFKAVARSPRPAPTATTEPSAREQDGVRRARERGGGPRGAGTRHSHRAGGTEAQRMWERTVMAANGAPWGRRRPCGVDV